MRLPLALEDGVIAEGVRRMARACESFTSGGDNAETQARLVV
jgi:hypothetical protein